MVSIASYRKIAFLLATLLFLVAAYVTVRTLVKTAASAEDVAKEQANFSGVRRLLSAMKDAETGQRGYLVTGDATFLEPYRAGRIDAMTQNAAARKAFLSTYPTQIKALETSIERELAFLEQQVELTHNGMRDAAVASAPRGKAAMDEVRARIEELSKKEALRVEARRKDLSETIAGAIVTFCVSLGLALLLAGLAGWSMLADLRALQLAEEALLQAQQGLEERVRRRTRELEESNGKLQEANRVLAEESERRSYLQDQLWVSNQRFQMAFEHAAIGMAQASEDGKLLLVNRQLCEITGYSEAELLTKSFAEIIHPEDAAESREYAKKLWAQEISASSLRNRYVRRDGTPVWVSSTLSVVRDEAGRPKYFVNAVQNIEREIAAERQLIENETRYRFLADSMPQMVWTARRDGSIDYFNQQWFDYTEASFEETGGWSWEEVVHPDDLPFCIEVWTRALQTGAPYQCEARLRRKADQAYRWHLSRALPLKDEHGQVERWFGTSTDIDDYKRVEAEARALNEQLEQRVTERTADLAESEARFRSLVEGVKDYAIVMLDPQGNVCSWTAGAQLLAGYTAEEILGKHFSCFYSEEDRAQGHPDEGMRIALETGQFTEEGWRVCQDGSRFWASVLLTTLRDEKGAVTGFAKITRNVSDRKRAQDLLEKKTTELEEANRTLSVLTKRAEQASDAKSSFLAAMSHEIRTPMNAILGMADLLWESSLDLEQRHYVEVFRRAGNNLLTLINDILDFSKIESGHFELEKIEFDLSELFDRTMELMEPKARAKGLELVSRLPRNLHTSVVGDPVRVQQILINLLGNAVKFTERGRVMLTARPDSHVPGRVFISVADTGIGIPADKLQHIFDDFTQADASTTRRFGGTGLGLGISKRLVALMGGELKVRSSVGCGSIFSFVVEFGSTATPVRAKAAPSLEDFRGRRVLVIDDDATNRLIVRETLNSWGLETRECETAMEAIREVEATIATNPYALILIDALMPEVGGFEAAASLRQIAPDIPIIMLTSDRQPGDAARCVQYQLTGYVEKPVQRAELLRLVRLGLGTEEVKHAGSENGTVKPAGASDRPLRLLIAEDATDNRILLDAYLKKMPYKVTFVENGQVAVEHFRKQSYDMVFMDMQMPVMDGLMATRLMRSFEHERGRTPTPIIALTANALTSDIAAAIEAGCNSHFSKPISKQKLLEVIEQRRKTLVRAGAQAEEAGTRPSAELEGHAHTYIENRKREVAVLRGLRASGNFPQLRALAHDLKGTSSSFGFPELTRLDDAIETSAAQQDGPALDGQLLELSRYLEKAAGPAGGPEVSKSGVLRAKEQRT